MGKATIEVLNNALSKLKALELQLDFNRERYGMTGLTIEEAHEAARAIKLVINLNKLYTANCEENINAVREAFHNGQTHAEAFKHE